MFWGNKYTTERKKEKKQRNTKKDQDLVSKSLSEEENTLFFNVSWVLQELPNELHSTYPDASPWALM
jgi:hypothetical protein